ncbi:dihydrofolate reductase family protein [Demequina sp. NBRC 110056]|uniref:dihydrofolate reductase family protein n=1 Tax=Demequina sp. NBRC 110056 TaxID=1570345 RepID=UPI001356430D|nr:dihydrofolate reductase family protein [Demequina sp. NBRC 110056]
MGRVRVYIASSLDGFIAGPHDDIAWLEAPRPAWAPMAAGPWADAEPDALGFEGFMADVGAMLMGRRTYDVVSAMGGEWPYGNTPILVATGRPLPDAPATVTGASAPIANLLDEARTLAAGRDVYLDGGSVIRQALDADLIDELTVTLHPTVLGSGHPLFAGVEHRRHITVTDVRRYGDGMVQLTLTPARPPRDASPVPEGGGPARDQDPGEPPLGLA